MKILFCNYEYPPLGGGGGVICARLAEHFAREHEVTVLTSASGDLSTEEVVNKVRILRVPVYLRREQAVANLPSMACYMLNGIRYGRRLLEREQFDIINTHFALPSGPVGQALASYADLPHVLSVHGGDLYDPSKFTSPHRHWILRTWVTRLLRQANAVVGNSRNTHDNVLNFYDSQLPVKSIPLGIDRPRFTACKRSDLGLREDDFVLVTVGRLVDRKGLDRLLQIIAKASIPRLKLLVIGSGPLEGELSVMARSLGLEKQVIFKGFVEEQRKQQLLNTADLYVSSSQHEGFGLVFLEAMAHALPVICYDHGGQSDFLKDGETGALLPLNDEPAFLDALTKLHQDDEGRVRVGQYNLRKVEAYYIEVCAERYKTLFDELSADKVMIGSSQC